MIWFMTPDLAAASGGIQVIYSIVAALNDRGVSACVWHGQDHHSFTSFSSTAVVVSGLEQTIDAGDILVMQEVGGPKWRFIAGDNPTVMLVQGHSFLFDGMDFTNSLSSGYPGWPNARAAVVVSEYIERTVHALAGDDFPVFRVPPAIDSARFAPAEKERTIAYMPRRRRADLIATVQLLRRGRMLPPGWTFTEIDGLDRDQVAERLSRSAIFLSGAEREGFGLPGAEAMAAGCAVVGFTGDGGGEYLRDDTALIVHDHDVLGLADAVASAARAHDAGDPRLRERIRQGRLRVLREYSAEASANAAVSAFTALLRRGSGATFTAPARISHYQAHAPKTGLGWSAYRGARRIARLGVDAIRGVRPSSRD